MCLQIILPRFADFFKSASGHLLTCACRNSPQVCRFSQISQWTFTDMCLQIFPPRFAHFLKSASGHLLTCACRNPLRFADFLKSATDMCLQVVRQNTWLSHIVGEQNNPWGNNKQLRKMTEGGEPTPRGIPRRELRVGITHLRAAYMVRMNISKGGETGRGRSVWRPNPQDFPPHNPQGVVYRPRGRGEPVVGSGLGRGREEPEVARGLGRGYGGPLGYLRAIRPLGHFPPPPPYVPCDPNPPPYDAFFLPSYSVRDPDISPC